MRTEIVLRSVHVLDEVLQPARRLVQLSDQPSLLSDDVSDTRRVHTERYIAHHITNRLKWTHGRLGELADLLQPIPEHAEDIIGVRRGLPREIGNRTGELLRPHFRKRANLLGKFVDLIRNIPEYLRG